MKTESLYSLFVQCLPSCRYGLHTIYFLSFLKGFSLRIQTYLNQKEHTFNAKWLLYSIQGGLFGRRKYS